MATMVLFGRGQTLEELAVILGSPADKAGVIEEEKTVSVVLQALND